jgi:hypothetical protein
MHGAIQRSAFHIKLWLGVARSRHEFPYDNRDCDQDGKIDGAFFEFFESHHWMIFQVCASVPEM